MATANQKAARAKFAAKARSGMGKLPTHEGARASSRLWIYNSVSAVCPGLSDISAC